MNIRENIAKNITNLRKQSKLTQTELGARLNFSDKTISKWESGVSLPDIEVLKDICDLFGITMDELMSEDATINAKKKLPGPNAQQIDKKIAVTTLAVIAVFLIATIIFLAYVWRDNLVVWQVFVWAVPISALIVFIYGSKVGDSKVLGISSLSVFIWGLLTSIYCQLLADNLWLLFLLGIPLEGMIVIWIIFLKRDKFPKENTSKKREK